MVVDLVAPVVETSAVDAPLAGLVRAYIGEDSTAKIAASSRLELPVVSRAFSNSTFAVVLSINSLTFSIKVLYSSSVRS